MNILVTPEAAVRAKNVRPLVRIVIVGHVDHGKSTLIGRLLHETGSLPEGKLETLKTVSERRGMPFEWSFLLDALQTERDQGITIDTSQIHFRTAARDFVLIDAPGHVEFLRNMITGAAQADGALLLIDAAEGVREQTRRHGYLLHLLGIRQVAVVVNKMDRVGFDEKRFSEIATEIGDYLSGLGIKPVSIIPVSARQGDGVAALTPAIDWYSGPTVLGALDRFSPATSPDNLALRLPVQAVYKFDDRRILVGRIESGRIAVGDEIMVMPGAKLARVKSIESWPVPNDAQQLQSIEAGRSAGITLDRELFIERGNVVSLASAPSSVLSKIRARVFWLHSTPLQTGTTVILRSGTAEIRGKISAIAKAIDPGELKAQETPIISQNQVGEVDVELNGSLAADAYTVNPLTGRFALDVDGRISGGGLILETQGVDTIERSPDFLKKNEDVTTSIAALAPKLKTADAAERLKILREEIKGRIVFTTSFGIEDQAILQMIDRMDLDIDVVTLDTGRLFPETYEVWAATERHFGRRIRAFYPRHDELETLVARQGINGFYESREARNACCFVRKVDPLNRALGGAQAWIVGLRADQSANRHDMAILSVDEARNLAKLSPIFDWSRDQTLEFISSSGVPINELHSKGFASIGCAPCTRALRPGEPERAGRWWWEDETKKECGLHSINAAQN